MEETELQGMTVNERLFVLNLMDGFENAIKIQKNMVIKVW